MLCILIWWRTIGKWISFFRSFIAGTDNIKAFTLWDLNFKVLRFDYDCKLFYLAGHIHILFCYCTLFPYCLLFIISPHFFNASILCHRVRNQMFCTWKITHHQDHCLFCYAFMSLQSYRKCDIVLLHPSVDSVSRDITSLSSRFVFLWTTVVN